MSRPRKKEDDLLSESIRIRVTKRLKEKIDFRKSCTFSSCPALSVNDIFRLVAERIDDEALLYVLTADKNDELLLLLRSRYIYNKQFEDLK